MTDIDRDGLDLRDEDRLPWLEAVDDEDGEEGVSPVRVAAFVLAALVLLGLVIGGIYWMQNRKAPPAAGEGALIAAPQGDYKMKPTEPGGMAVEGKGDTTFAASEGQAPTGRIDLDAVAEDPVAARAAPRGAAPAPAPKAAKVASASVAGPATRLAPAPAKLRAAAPAGAAGSVIQLGAFGSEATANGAWKSLSGRFAYLAPLTPTVSVATVGGKTYYRLQADAGAGARDVCGRLKVAGENCLIVGN